MLPLLCFRGECPTNTWNVSVLYFAQSDRPPILHIGVREFEQDVDETRVEMYPIVTGLPEGTTAYRYTIRTRMAMAREITVQYEVWVDDDDDSTEPIHHHRYEYRVPARDDTPRCAVFSCNGFHDPEKDWDRFGGIEPMWGQMREMGPFHLLIGGGDQLYADPVWKQPLLTRWLTEEHKDKEREFSEELYSEVYLAYWDMYRTHFSPSSSASFAHQLATVPYVFNWDDHDIFDGAGSYDSDLQESRVFQGIFGVARFFYLLFQQHTTLHELQEDNDDPLVSDVYMTIRQSDHPTFNRFYKAGDCCFIVFDTRSERTRHRVLSRATYRRIETDFLARDSTQWLLREKCAYLFVVLPIPVVYPDMSFYIDMFDSSLLEATGVLNDQFGHVGFIDDTYDQWTNKFHVRERDYLVEGLLLGLQRRFPIRTVFLTGDVHAYAFAKIRPRDARKENKERMYHVCSSPIGNAPMMSLLNAVLNGNLALSAQLPIGHSIYGSVRHGRYVAERNFCVLQPDTERSSRHMMALLYAEGQLAEGRTPERLLLRRRSSNNRRRRRSDK